MEPTAWLVLIDWTLVAVGAAILIRFTIPVTIGSRRDPLAGVPHPSHHMREEAVFLAVCAYLLSALALDTLAAQWFAEAEDIRRRLIAANGAHVIGTLAVAWIVAKNFDGGLVGFLRPALGDGRGRFGSTVLATAIVGIGLCPLLAEGTSRVIQWFAPSTALEIHPTLQALHGGEQSKWVTACLWLGAAVAAPVAEESFFRGVLQNVIGGVSGRRWAAIAVTATAFGAVHVSQPQTIPALIVLGVLLGFAYERTGTILSPIAIHALFNLKTLIWSALGAPISGTS